MTPPAAPPPCLPALQDGRPRALRVIAPPRGWPGLGLSELWEHRDLLRALLARDIRVRYRQTALGVLWAVLRPLGTMLVFALVIGRVADLPSEGAPYALFAYAGLLPWSFASSAIGGAGPSLVNAAGWIQKVWFPRLLLPLAYLGAATLDLGVALLLLVPLLLHFGVAPGASLLLLPVVLLWLAAATAAVSVLLAALTARWRDFAHALPFLLQLGLFVTPVLFPRGALPEAGRTWAALNPLTGPVEAFRWAVLGRGLDVEGWTLSLVSGLLLGLAALVWFRSVERRLADLL